MVIETVDTFSLKRTLFVNVVNITLEKNWKHSAYQKLIWIPYSMLV
ncbi:Uncharacterised protein [Mycobacterium tuberculosis]|nr:Uncharacterised protein [Mycobacterium tuberculosis]